MALTRVVGLDLGSTCVRAAEVELRPGRSVPVRLLRYGEQAVDAHAMRDGEVVRPASVTAALRTLWKRDGFRTRDVVLGVGNQRVFVRNLSLPAMPMDQLRASLRYGPVQELLPVQVEDCLLDYHPIAVDGAGTVSGMLVAAPEETVEANTSAVSAAGLRPVRVDLNAFGLLRALIHGPLRSEVVGIVDVGATITDIVIADHGVLRQSRTLPQGSDDVTSAIRQALSVPEQQAEQIKRTVGLRSPQSTPPELGPAVEMIRRRCEVLVGSVRDTFQFYAAADGRAVERLVLTGRGSLTPGLGQLLATTLGIPVAFAQPHTHVDRARTASGQRIEEAAPVLSVALGLAQAGAAR